METPQKHQSQGSSLPPKRQRRAVSPIETIATQPLGTIRSVVAQTPSTSLFDLPRELRDQIYHEAFINATFELGLPATSTRRASCHQFKIRYGNGPDKCKEKSKSKESTWMFASRQIFEEASEQFHRNATWEYHSNLNRYGRSFTAWRPPERKSSTKKQAAVLLTIHSAQSINLTRPLVMRAHFDSNSEHKQPRRSAAERYGHRYEAAHTVAHHTSSILFDSRSTNLLRDFHDGLTGSPSLRRLSLKLALRTRAIPSHHDCAENRVNVDLQLLSSLKLPNLRLLELMADFDKDFWDDHSLTDRLMTSIDQAGNVLLGEDSVQTFVTVYIPHRLMREWHLSFAKGGSKVKYQA